MRWQWLACVSLGGLLWQASLQAGEVRIKDVHLCCGACVAGVNEALEDVEGVDGVAADRNAKVVSFSAEDDEAAAAGIAALAKAGFHGAAQHDAKPIAFPASGAKKDQVADRIVIGGVHLCCAACVKGAQEAVQKVKGLSAIEIDRKERVVRLIGEQIRETEAIAALNAGGFHGTIVREK